MLLITGATGTIGTHLLGELAGRDDVRALVRDRAGAAAVERAGAQAVVGRFEDPASLRTAMAGVERVFLLSPPGDQAMVDAQTRVVDAAVDAGVAHVVKLSSIGADAPGDARIVRAHRTIEQHVEASGLAWTHLRPHWFMQNELGQAASIADGVLHAPDVGRITTIDARDVAAAAARVLTTGGHAGRSYLLTGPEPLSYADVAAALSEAVGRPVRWDEVTLEDARASMLDAGLPEVLAGGFTEILAGYRRGGEAARVSPDVEALTGRPPRTFRAFARDHREQLAPAASVA